MATPGKYHFKPVAYGFQKDSPFLPLFNYNLNKMRERGSLEQIQVKYEPPPQICPDYSGKALGVSSVFSGFGVLFSVLELRWFCLVLKNSHDLLEWNGIYLTAME